MANPIPNRLYNSIKFPYLLLEEEFNNLISVKNRINEFDFGNKPKIAYSNGKGREYDSLRSKWIESAEELQESELGKEIIGAFTSFGGNSAVKKAHEGQTFDYQLSRALNLGSKLRLMPGSKTKIEKQLDDLNECLDVSYLPFSNLRNFYFNLEGALTKRGKMANAAAGIVASGAAVLGGASEPSIVLVPGLATSTGLSLLTMDDSSLEYRVKESYNQAQVLDMTRFFLFDVKTSKS